MADKFDIGRRDFFKQAAGVIGATTQRAIWPGLTEASPFDKQRDPHQATKGIRFPRVFTGDQLKMLAMPLGGVAAGSIALGGRGQLRDWEIFNRPNKGFSPDYAFPAIWVQTGESQPIVRVLESQILPPYEGQDGLGSSNAPGLSRLAAAEFTGQYPLAQVRFKDPLLPVDVELEAFSPFIPHDHDDSGLPVAVLRYRLHNPGAVTAKASIVFSIDNPVNDSAPWEDQKKANLRVNEHRTAKGIEGLFMTNPGLPVTDHKHGSFVLGVLAAEGAHTTHWAGWEKGRWWNAPMFFWDNFSRDGALLAQPTAPGKVGSLCQQHILAPGATATVTFILAWHFPNRTPAWCGWDSPAGHGDTVIGNYYSTRFKSAWEAATYTAANLERLESRTLAFLNAFSQSTLPDVVKEAASANLSTLASTTCFRTADGEFHGFEGSDNQSGCCSGNCTHVWNYETATTFLFPLYARSLRESAFGYSMDDQGGMRFRQMLPDGIERSKIVAADGQMGQILHAYMDWKHSGDKAWLVKMWPKIKKAIAFAWIPGGWDANRDGVLEGVQHTTYDVEFYGPNPLGQILYLGALRSAEEMARSVGDRASAAEYRSLFEKGSHWIDVNLFQGEYYKQEIRGFRRDQIAPQLISGFGSDSTDKPEFQVGGGCLVDQLLGQYLAHIGGLGPLVSPANTRATLDSVYRYNYKRSLADHDAVQRTYALNNEAAVVICDYGKATRPAIPFPYYAEAWTGLEHSTAALMFYEGLIDEGVEYIENLRSRYDGIKRNPWDEAECGHHYARAMASWSSVVALGGFRYEADNAHVFALPPLPHEDFRCFWATGTGWGNYSLKRQAAGKNRLSIQVLSGSLSCRSCTMIATGSKAAVHSGGNIYPATVEQASDKLTVRLAETLSLKEGDEFEIIVEV